MAVLEQYGSDRRIVVERTATEAPDLAQALVRVTRALTEHGLATGEWRAGEPPGRPIELTDQNLQTHLSEVRQAQAAGEPAFVALLSGKLAVILNGEQTPAGALSSVTVTLPPDRQDHEQVSALLNDVVIAFGAFHGQVEENRLFLVYHSQRAAERAWAATPQEYRQYLPGPEPLPPDPDPGCWFRRSTTGGRCRPASGGSTSGTASRCRPSAESGSRRPTGPIGRTTPRAG